jgi:hypothetical protein
VGSMATTLHYLQESVTPVYQGGAHPHITSRPLRCSTLPQTTVHIGRDDETFIPARTNAMQPDLHIVDVTIHTCHVRRL